MCVYTRKYTHRFSLPQKQNLSTNGHPAFVSPYTYTHTHTQVLSTPETESVNVWSSSLRFAIFDRHPTRIKWLLTYVFDIAAPNAASTSSNNIVTIKRLMMTRPLLNELAWRGAPLQRQVRVCVCIYIYIHIYICVCVCL